MRVLASSAFCAYKILPLEASIAIADLAATVKSFVVGVVAALTEKPERTDRLIRKLQKIIAIFFHDSIIP